MRSLTPAEASVVRSLLADEPVPHRERIRRSGLPARTYEVARRRLRIAGYVVERYVPDPIRLGRPIARFVLARPFAERFSAEARRWREDERAVIVWEGAGSIFAVLIDEEGGDESASAPTDGRTFTLRVDLRRPSVPAYFDFESAWARLAELPGTYRYPRPLAPRGSGNGSAALLSRTERAVVRQLVDSSFQGGGDGESPVPGLFPRRRLRRALSEGLVEHRAFLDVTQLPPYRGLRVESIVMVRAELGPGATAPGLFRALVARSRVAPFLFATDGREILLGGLSPAPAASSEGRVPVLATLRESVQGIDVTRLPVDELVPSINHRYDRLVTDRV